MTQIEKVSHFIQVPLWTQNFTVAKRFHVSHSKTTHSLERLLHGRKRLVCPLRVISGHDRIKS